MKIIESITDDFATNQEIEGVLAHLPKDQQTLVLDGLEQVYQSPHGLSVADWMRSMKMMVSGPQGGDAARVTDEQLHSALAIMTEHFPTMVSRDGDVLTWRREPIHQDSELDMGDPMTQLAKAQIEYTSMIIDLMKNHGRFSTRDIMTTFAAMSGLDPDMVRMLVQHIIDSNSGSIRQVGPDQYEMIAAQRPATPAENMAMWRDLAARGSVEK